MAKGFNRNGVILWEGISAIDGSPIVVIATGLTKGSTNAKTGAQVQTFIIRSDMDPLAALGSGADRAICGDCCHRPFLVEAAKAAGEPIAAKCYVNVGRSVMAVWACFARGGYARVTPFEAAEILAGRDLRFGAYGDPAAAPYAMWARIASKAASVTGYTHQWRTCDQRFAGLTMASADSEGEAREAWAAGWRTFRVAAPGERPIAKAEAACPASKEMGQRTKCEACKACGGAASKARVSMMIWDHSAAGAAAARRLAA